MLDILTTRYRGQFAEKLAEKYLSQQGIVIIARNFSCRQGEIDLIGRDSSGLIFIEVRFRKSQQFGNACETVDWKKQRKLITAAQYYLQKQQLTNNIATRFDVVGITPKNSATSVVKQSNHLADYDIQWIQNAFQ